MSDYWQSTKTPVHAFRPSYQTAEGDKFLRETVGIDSALLVADLGISEIHVKAYQRRLGVRTITGRGRKAESF